MNKIPQETDKPEPLSVEEVLKQVREVEDAKEDMLVALGKKRDYIVNKIREISPLWWKTVSEMLVNGSPEEKRLAVVEINKLQGKSLPTELTGPDGEGLVVNIVGYTAKQKNVEENDTNSL